MMSIFAYCMKFNGDVSKWDVSKVTTLHGAFLSYAWKGDISKWNVGKVIKYKCIPIDTSLNAVTRFRASQASLSGQICGRVSATCSCYIRYHLLWFDPGHKFARDIYWFAAGEYPTLEVGRQQSG